MKQVTIDTQSKTLEIRCPTTDRALTLRFQECRYTITINQLGLEDNGSDQVLSLMEDNEDHAIEILGITPPITLAEHTMPMLNDRSHQVKFLAAYIDGGIFHFSAEPDWDENYDVQALTFRDAINILVRFEPRETIGFDIADGKLIEQRSVFLGQHIPSAIPRLQVNREGWRSGLTQSGDMMYHPIGQRRNILQNEILSLSGLYEDEEPQVRSTPQCKSCRFYPSDRHTNPYLVCAVRPYGPNSDECSDWEEQQQSLNTENDDRISFNSPAIDPGRNESVSVFSICRRNESGEIEIIGQVEDRIGASFTINAPGTYLLRRDDRAQLGRVVSSPTGYEASINDRPLYRLETGLANHQIRNKTFSHRVDLIKGDRIERTWYQESDQQRLEAVRFLSFYLEWLLCEDSDRWERLCSYLMMNMPSSEVLTEDPVQRRVARDEINGVIVSTIRLPIDQAIMYSSGQEYAECVVFETKCFEADGDRLSLPNELMDEVWTSTEEEAIAAHNQYCRIAQRGSENYHDDRSEFARVVVTYTDNGERQSIELPRTIDRPSTPSRPVIDSVTIAPNQELNDDEIAFLQQPLTWEEDEPQP